MRRTVRTLADGRQIIYFDTSLIPERHAFDTRSLSIAATRSDVRFDPLLGEWVVLAAHRQTRTHLPTADLCPLCPSAPDRATEIPESDYEVVTFENRFPAFAGSCEVVCFTSDHDAAFVDLELDRVKLVVDVWADRTAALSARDGVAQVFCFENHGAEIGVTLTHPHGQIYGYPFVTPRAEKISANTARYASERGRSLVADLIDDERQAGSRVVSESAHWVAFVPAAARWPFEVQFFPLRRVADIPDLDDEQRADFAHLYLDVLRRFVRIVDDSVPYVAAWNQAPRDRRNDWWLHLQLFSVRRAEGKLKYLAGSESGMGVFISDTTPEDVATRLRALG
ncbi:galactose-1-phosphate uridylyltransferase [Antrihabitans sp. YC2-6]|uniref:galactose-1-phosphate uridylyltransferase n=1 Tax=Antrihabitans sp. YC2-6 TaxID=2799498 RepID=UPI0018F574B3|nr:galactose-1-phosphate uridylyltransferase [Antrihabitans sp. YC2-6]MBJ8348748.1 galactose-1-phosphate uridylyltransferase [Antrihabitans sp. YC2-6]